MIHDTGEFWIYECDRCDTLKKMKKTDPNPPDGYILKISRISSGRRDRKNYVRFRSATPWFCDIECFKEGIQFHTYDDIEDETVFLQ